jgi:hypothetical protein
MKRTMLLTNCYLYLLPQFNGAIAQKAVMTYSEFLALCRFDASGDSAQQKQQRSRLANLANSVAISLVASTASIASLSALAAPPTPITGLTGGAVSIAAANRNSANPQVAVGIEGLGFFVGNTSGADAGTSTNWVAQTCEGCSFARNAVWDDAGQLWVAGSGYGLWRRTAAGAFAKVALAEANVVQWVARGVSDTSGKLWLALGNGVATMDAQGKVTRQGTGSESLNFTALTVNAAGSKAYGLGGGDVYSMDANDAKGAWKPLGAPKAPTAIEVIDDVLYVGTDDGLYSLLYLT